MDISAAPELLALAEEVRRTGRPRLLRRANTDLALLVPAEPTDASAARRVREPGSGRSARLPKGRVLARTADDLKAVEHTAGIFRDYAKSPPATSHEEQEAFEQAVAEQVMESMRS